MTTSRDTELVSLRRALHAHPELGFCEIETAARIIDELATAVDTLEFGSTVCAVAELAGLPPAEELDHARRRALEAGIEPELVERLGHGNTGVVASVRGRRPGPVIALRCDMDGLPITESEDAAHPPFRGGFASEVSGIMHACGHDGHVAIGVTLAKRLAEDRNFAGELRVIFQPAEEGVRGARAMVAAGAARGVDVMLGLHLGIGLDVGTVASSTSGVMATEKWKIELTGAPAHAALAPSEGRNALLGAATIALGLHALPPFAQATTRVNVGKMTAGTSANIIADSAEIHCELRADDTDVFAELTSRARDVVLGAAGMYGLGARIDVIGSAEVAVCDSEIARALDRCAHTVDDITNALPTAPMSASDDVTLFMADVQRRGGKATFVLVGASSPAPHHHPRFDIDERSLPIAADWLEQFIRTQDYHR
ncbi:MULTISPECIES: amidohydrolase [Rhodococcus]|uniref:amidohydrolase n=1 Tax=Rhodococcus TaxID=1827 RepID=UPI000304B599|nr:MULTISPECIES: amidohydrolase [Rhodococcus]UOT08070.1 amidohydrolase [Rhodococcus opacus]